MESNCKVTHNNERALFDLCKSAIDARLARIFDEGATPVALG